MAEGSDGGSSWWGGWLQTAKDKSASALELVKKDLAEFTCTMQQDTAKAADTVKDKLTQENAVSATEKVKAGVGTFLSGISRALVIEPEDKDYPGEPITTYDRAQAQLHAIQIDPGTYLTAPTGPKEAFEKWLTTFDLDSRKGDISELLVANVEVRSLYTQLVPSQVSHASYWQRYFYKVHKWQLEQERKAELMRRAVACNEQKELDWDEEDDWDDMAGPSSPPKNPTSPLKAEGATTTPVLPAPPKEEEEDNQQKTEDDEAVPTKLSKTENPDSAPTNTESKPEEAQLTENVKVKVTLLHEDFENKQTTDSSENDALALEPSVADTTVVSPTDTLSSASTGISESSSSCKDESSLDTLTLVSPVSAENTPGDTESKAFAESTNVAEEEPALPPVAELPKEIKTKEKGDLVVVGSVTSSDRTTPSSDSANSNNKESGSLDEDWEQDFDIEVTEEDLKLAQEASKNISLDDDENGDEWENWE